MRLSLRKKDLNRSFVEKLNKILIYQRKNKGGKKVTIFGFVGFIPYCDKTSALSLLREDTLRKPNALIKFVQFCEGY